MASTLEKLEISRLINRFGFGPKPGEFASLLAGGVTAARSKILGINALDSGLAGVVEPRFIDLGNFPPSNTPERVKFAQDMRSQNIDLQFWWMDRMVLADVGLQERLTWFWHGHWATSIGKVEYALPMKLQNETLRQNALGNFKVMARTMVIDPALMYWLDSNGSVKGNANENLSREFMELFTLGVGNYTQDDVVALAKAFTGWHVDRSSGVTSFDAKKHDSSALTILGTTASWDAQAVSDFIVSTSANAKFITDRLWFRFLSTSTPKPADLEPSFVDRDILKAVIALATHKSMQDPTLAQAKSPLEWFVGICRALKITPSVMQNRAQVINYLDKLGQVPFLPPNVGGWPFDSAWINLSTSQYRVAFASYLVEQGDLTPITGLFGLQMQNALQNWLGIPELSMRTKAVIRNQANTSKQILISALCAPEYVVSA